MSWKPQLVRDQSNNNSVSQYVLTTVVAATIVSIYWETELLVNNWATIMYIITYMYKAIMINTLSHIITY